MKIDTVSLYRVAMPRISPWRTAYGSDLVIESLLVRLTSGEFTGWGESSPLATPTYSPEYCRGVFNLAREFIAPRLPGGTFDSPEELAETWRFLKGNPFAKAGFDMAWWDLAAVMAGQPLWRMLGGVNPRYRCGADFGIQDSIDILLEKIARAVGRGFPRIKLKYGPGWGIEVIDAVRKAFPDTVFHIDCNSAYTLDDLPMFRELDRYNLAMIEQPLAHDDLIDHAKLQSAIATAVCLDESLTSPAKARQAIEIGAARCFNIKPGRVGGITNSLEINRLAEAAGIPCWVGGMLESGVGRTLCLALGTLPNMSYPADIFPPLEEFHSDLLVEPLDYDPCPWFAASEAPGSGVRIDPERFKAVIVEEFHLP